ncbi:unnamed protein product [Paramecium pentaurelia]|uniref:Uncharacterized protein n=1 Tax=Paramecium pentaurelia TaxID=43138 RepID=A0A8S1SSV1_9CILI|nr:unnamed protein product [Paramecium pentaurelia]
MMKSELQSQFIPLTYQSQPQYTYQQKDLCNAIAINHNNTILVVAADKHLNFQFQRSQIKVMEIIYSNTSTIINLNQIQIIQDQHFGFINTLNFFKKNPFMLDNFISGSQDNQIIIWQLEIVESSKFWIPIFKLKEHSSSINCLVLRPFNEDLIISACDKKIKFWSLSNYQFLSPLIYQGWECFQTIKEHKSYVFGLSINQEGNRVVSCGYDKQILIIEESNRIKWYMKQKIQTYNIGFRICFIINNLFAYQSLGINLQLFKFNEKNEKFQKIKEIPVKGGNCFCSPYFPSSYINTQNLFVTKNGYHLNFIRFIYSHNQSQDFQCSLESSIEFDQKGYWGYIYGTLSEDGKLLITWDFISEQIQFRTQMIKN